jgi:AraC family transcriptional activator of pobA
MATTIAIPSYALYGEAAPQNGLSNAGFAHIETIADRSSLHDWEIAPHRHADFVQILLVREGHAAITLDGCDAALDGPCRVVAPAAIVHGFRFRQGTQGFVLTLSADFAARGANADDPLLLALARGGAGLLEPAAAARAFWLAGEMLQLQQEWQDGDPLFMALAEALVRTITRDPLAGTDEASADRRAQRFRQLVELHFREHRGLDFYAASLGLTRRTLSRLSVARLGCAPMDVVHRRLTLEAQRLLRYTNATAAQVSAELGFDDPSYFSRFYLRMTGRRPAEDRRAG